MFYGHKDTNLYNVPPTLYKFVSGHIFDISFHHPSLTCHRLSPQGRRAVPLRTPRRTPTPPTTKTDGSGSGGSGDGGCGGSDGGSGSGDGDGGDSDGRGNCGSDDSGAGEGIDVVSGLASDVALQQLRL